MWLLLFIIVDLAGGTHSTTELGSYMTQRECNGELERIWLQMIKAYPTDHDGFYMVCRLKEAV